MKLSTWTIGAFLAAAIVFLTKAGADPEGGSFDTTNLLLAAGYCTLWALVLYVSRGLLRSIMLLAGVAIFEGYVVRLLVLAFDEAAFRYDLFLMLTSEAVAKALVYIIAGTVAFSLGSWLAVRLCSSSPPNPAGSEQWRALLASRRSILTLGLLIVSVWALINFTVGLRWQESSVPFVMKLVPVEPLLFLVMLLAVGGWSRFSSGERASVVVFVLMFVLSGVMVGSRGSLFFGGFAFLIALVLLKGDPVIPLKWVLLGGALAAVIVPLALMPIWTLREVVREDRASVLGLLLSTDWRDFIGLLGEMDPFYLVLALLNRESYADITIFVLNYRPPEMDVYGTIGNLARSFVEGLVPGFILPKTALATQTLFAVFYEGLPLGVAHGGAFSGFGFFHAYFGAIAGLVGLALLGFLGSAELALLRSGGSISLAVQPFVAHIFIFNMLVGGNVETVGPLLLINAATLSLVVWLATSVHVSGEHARRPFREPPRRAAGRDGETTRTAYANP